MPVKRIKITTKKKQPTSAAVGGQKRERDESPAPNPSAVSMQSSAVEASSTATSAASAAQVVSSQKPAAAHVSNGADGTPLKPAAQDKAALRAQRLARLKALKSKGAFAASTAPATVALAAAHSTAPSSAKRSKPASAAFGDDEEEDVAAWGRSAASSGGPALPSSAAAPMQQQARNVDQVDSLEAFMQGIQADSSTAGLDTQGGIAAGPVVAGLADLLLSPDGDGEGAGEQDETGTGTASERQEEAAEDGGGEEGQEGGPVVDEDEFHKSFLAQMAQLADSGGHSALQVVTDAASAAGQSPAAATSSAPAALEVLEGDDDILENAEVMVASKNTKSALEQLRERMAKKDLKQVDHATIEYTDFKKDFYIEAPEVAAQAHEVVKAARDDMEMTVRGRDVPKPLGTWQQAGLSVPLQDVLSRSGFEAPFAIQRQAIPCIMSGRDVIGIAKTGSGKTLAYLLPMLRHIADQAPVEECQGPVGLIMVPARELAVQVYSSAKKFCKALGLRMVAVYGGASVADQLAGLKRGCHVVVCTPGRLIDILTMNSGRALSLQRVTYLVLDEADRMFDMGFEPQVNRIVRNTRPDRQTVMFSATFPAHVESLARKILASPIEIVVGGRSVSSSDVTQHVELINERAKFKHLLKWLGKYYDKGCVLVFVDTQERCDTLFADLTGAGYPSLSLHGGKDQYDRDSTIADFKNKVRRVMVATSVAGRGLDVKDLVLVVNFCCPNHMEDYVHRIGRTGRAGNKGTAVTFITEEESLYAPDIVKALTASKQQVPEGLAAMAQKHSDAVKAGHARKRRSGYATQGFRFDGTELSEEQWLQILQRMRAEVADGQADVAELDKVETEYKAWRDKADISGQPQAITAGGEAAPMQRIVDKRAVAIAQAKVAAAQKALAHGTGTPATLAAAQSELNAAKAGVLDVRADGEAAAAARQAAQAAAASISDSLGLAASAPLGGAAFSVDLEINDYPQKARFKVQKKDTIRGVYEQTGCGITTRGLYFAPGRRPGPGEQRLTLHIEGASEQAVMSCKHELRRILEETTAAVTFDDGEYARMMMQ